MISKRIAVISYHTCPLSDEKASEIGGLNIYVLELSKELSKKGYVIDIYTRSTEVSSEKIVKVSENLRIIHIKAGGETKIPKRELLQYVPEFITNLSEFIKNEKLHYDLINCHYYLSGLIGIEIKNNFKVPMTITFHTLALMKNLVARGDEEREDISRIESEIILTRKADMVIATSKTDAQYVHALYNCPSGKISVLSPGVNHDIFKPMNKDIAKKYIHADPSYKLILFVGRIQPLKGIDVLLYAMKILMQQNPKLKICLWLVGGDTSGRIEQWSEELQRLEKIRSILKISTAVKFVGMKQQSQLPYYYNSAEIVVMPSQYESFGITALEAMACGTPVITTDVSGVSSILNRKHERLITSASNPIRLALKIKSLITNPNQYDAVSKDVFSKVQRFSWEETADRYIKLLI